MPFAVNGACSIYYETFGAPADPALLLINGMTSQCIFYPVEWCEMFVAAGLFVIRMDNRDVGLSSDCAGVDYTLQDMALDCVAVLDACGVDRAHIHGLSLGGMIAQTIAIAHPERVLTLTSVMSSSGEDEYRCRPRPAQMSTSASTSWACGHTAARRSQTKIAGAMTPSLRWNEVFGLMDPAVSTWLRARPAHAPKGSAVCRFRHW
jgi:pimeloyl-ACP methyl ester carboxylesterase